MLAAIGVVTKLKPNGAAERRLVHDLRHNSVNKLSRLLERTALPPVVHLENDVLELWEASDDELVDDEGLCFLALDFLSV
jgi:hypothetical protein